jgi:hypothetical protein
MNAVMNRDALAGMLLGIAIGWWGVAPIYFSLLGFHR